MEGQRWGHCHGCKSMATKVLKLSEELIEEIILRLPPPSVARFKCVSSLWRRRLSKLEFVDRYQAVSVSLIGFLYNKGYDRIRFAPIPSNIQPDNSTGYIQRPTKDIFVVNGGKDSSLTIVTSSNGLQLLYYSNFTEKDLNNDPFYIVRNLQRRDEGIVIKTFRSVSYTMVNVTKRFLVFGFAFDPYSIKPNFTIVEVTNDVFIGNRMRSIKYSSLVPGKWEGKEHDVPDSLGDSYMLSGLSTFFNGSLHWLLEPSGVVAYNIREESLSFSLMNIPGDRGNLDENGLCGCIKKIRDGGCYTNGECTCRYLGETRDRLVYVRVTGNSNFSLWVLDDYYSGIWSQCRRIVVDDLPSSLLFGKVLAFDRRDAHVVFLRVKRSIFSYNCITRELKKLCGIIKNYGGEDNCLGFIIPYELPRIPVFIPCDIPSSSNCTSSKDISKCRSNLTKTREINRKANPNALRRYLNNDGVVHLFHHFGVSQVAVKFFPHLQPLGDLNGPPIRSAYDFYAPITPAALIDTIVRYNDFVRVEACLYGCVSELTHPNP